MKIVNKGGRFTDLLENKSRKLNEVFDVTEERYQEINSKLKNPSGDAWVLKLEDLKVAELKELADLNDLEYPSNIKKADLIDLF